MCKGPAAGVLLVHLGSSREGPMTRRSEQAGGVGDEFRCAGESEAVVQVGLLPTGGGVFSQLECTLRGFPEDVRGSLS